MCLDGVGGIVEHVTAWATLVAARLTVGMSSCISSCRAEERKGEDKGGQCPDVTLFLIEYTGLLFLLMPRLRLSTCSSTLYPINIHAFIHRHTTYVASHSLCPPSIHLRLTLNTIPTLPRYTVCNPLMALCL